MAVKYKYGYSISVRMRLLFQQVLEEQRNTPRGGGGPHDGQHLPYSLVLRVPPPSLQQQRTYLLRSITTFKCLVCIDDASQTAARNDRRRPRQPPAGSRRAWPAIANPFFFERCIAFNLYRLRRHSQPLTAITQPPSYTNLDPDSSQHLFFLLLFYRSADAF